MEDVPRHPGRPTVVPPVRTRARTPGSAVREPSWRPTRDQVRAGEWRRSSRGLYVPTWVDPAVPEQRVVEAAALLPSVGGVTGWAALRWAGGFWFDGRVGGSVDGSLTDVTLAVGGSNVRPQPGIAMSEERLNPTELAAVDGLPLTVAVRSVCFEARYAPSLWRAVEVIDMAAYSDLASIDEVAAYVATRSGWTGVQQCRDALALADENSWSPPETWLRLVWELVARRGRPLTNRPVFDLAGRHLGTPDLVDPEAGVVGEYDGALHLAGSRRALDVAREATYRRAGLECVTAVAGDRPHRDRVAARVDDAYHRAAAAPAGRRQWTIDPPSWWVPAETVAQRRALTAEQRDRWLAHRLRPAA